MQIKARMSSSSSEWRWLSIAASSLPSRSPQTRARKKCLPWSLAYVLRNSRLCLLPQRCLMHPFRTHAALTYQIRRSLSFLVPMRQSMRKGREVDLVSCLLLLPLFPSLQFKRFLPSRQRRCVCKQESLRRHRVLWSHLPSSLISFYVWHIMVSYNSSDATKVAIHD